ncbi:MAG: hypothetical protein JETT_2043 [Candidatus Jettenia ecosi]|uniref:Phospholipase D-like domain-containing protein n=1 Tax=Candidatus Jettenia ecosi TaxID=2494326 RepID=A0A533QAH4_9BACT|nr:MAG: hypothetical protein JETT_2043 [Candidatus Jettenia ecosi]
MGIKIFIIIMLGLALNSLCIANNLYYAPQGTIQGQLKEGIQYTQRSLDICIHDFAAVDIEKELNAARDRGVQVRIVILKHTRNDLQDFLAKALIDKKFDVRVLYLQLSDKLVQDFIIFDNRMLAIGVYNWLAYRNRIIYNDVLFYYDPDKIHVYKNTFYRLFTEGEVAPLSATQNERTARDYPSVPEIDSRTTDEKQSIPDNIPNEETVIADKPERPAEITAKEFIHTSFEEMDKKFGRESSLSRSERNELWKKYKGKYVQWRGIVSYKGMGRVDWNRIGISHDNDKDAEVEVIFDWKMFEKVMDVRIGRTIIYTGKLVSRPGINAPYRLDDGDIE